MGYEIEALIGSRPVLAAHSPDYRHVRVVPLSDHLALIPITDALHVEIGSGSETAGFAKLSPHVEQWAKRLSSAVPIAYVEAFFFGGSGGQSAIAWSGGTRVLGPIHQTGTFDNTDFDTINEALRLLGVFSDSGSDEFAEIGLGRYRHTEDWC